MRKIIFDHDGMYVSPYEVNVFKKKLQINWTILKICDKFALDIIRLEIKNKNLDYKDIEFIIIDDDTEEEIVCLFDDEGRWYNPKINDCIERWHPANKYMNMRLQVLMELG